MLEQVEAGQLVQDLKMNVLQAIQYIIQDWNEVTANTIQNCWNHVKILSDDNSRDENGYENGYENDSINDELNEAIKALHLPNMIDMEEFLNNPEEDIVYEIPNDQVISEIASLFKNGANTNNSDEIDDSIEIETICINKALQSLKTVHTFLLQQENANEHIKLVSKIEKFIKN